ncbi:MAG TPA: galactokinase [Chitinophagaceae bacterium]|nr:galactokinase [Chitinophagaceae bacterium]
MQTVPPQLKEFIKRSSIVVRSPGRINMIGEHTDYNDGFVLPAAIDKAAYIAITPRGDKKIHLHSIDLNDEYVTQVDEVSKSSKAWCNYLLGVVHQFIEAGINMNGFDAALTADVPIGAGLSSSAAVECAMALALNEITGAGIDKLTLVKMAQKAEQEYAGVQCGIMDQFASMFGKKNCVIRLDCRSLEYSYEPFVMNGFKIVLLDTNVKHSLASSEYNVRRMQCETGVALIRQHKSEIKSLRDATMDLLNEYVLPQDITIYRRCKYVIEERDRLLAACKNLEANDMAAFGAKMFETHEGLSKLYEVSCPELDFLVADMRNNPAVLGARMMGGGFGGCTLNIIKDDAVDELVQQTSAAYKAAMHKELKAYIVNIEDGGAVIQ